MHTFSVHGNEFSFSSPVNACFFVYEVLVALENVGRDPDEFTFDEQVASAAKHHDAKSSENIRVIELNGSDKCLALMQEKPGKGVVTHLVCDDKRYVVRGHKTLNGFANMVKMAREQKTDNPVQFALNAFDFEPVENNSEVISLDGLTLETARDIVSKLRERKTKKSK